MSTRRRILLVEDNPGDALLAKRLLADCDVEHVPTFAQALAATDGEPFDVALLDMHLPDGAGPPLVARLAGRAPLLPIIVLTGSMTDENALAGIAQGAQDWLPKQGLDADRLRRTIDHAIQRKAFEQRFAESEERFRQLADNTQSVFWIFTADLAETVYVNAAYDRILGSNRERLYADATEWQRIMHSDDRARVIDAMVKLGRGEATLDTRLRIQRPDNTTRWVHLRGFTIRDAAGSIYRIAGTMDDITALHEAEGLLTAANLRLSNILDTAAEGIYGIDLQGRITFINRAGAEMIGLSPERLIGKDAHATFHHTRADGREHPVVACPIYKVMRDGTTRREERDAFWRTDGTKFHVSHVTSPKVVDGRIEGAVVVFADITERARAEEGHARAEARLRGMFESATSRIVLTDGNGIILASNEPGARHGVAARTGTSILDVLPDPGFIAQLNEALAAAQAGRPTHWVGELPGIASAVDVTVTPVGGPGAEREILWESRDVTELVKARRDAEAAQARLEEVQRFRVRFLNSIAHDMGTPLMVLRLRLDHLAQQPTTPDGARSIDARTFDSIQASTARLIVLTRDLRDVSLMQAGTFRLHLREMDLVPVALATMGELQDIASRAGVRLVAKLPDEPLVVHGDETRLSQALTNLLTNAIKFSPGRGEVTLRAGRVSGRIHLDVTDAGPGVPPDARARLFAPFSQVHEDTEAKAGTGLGLYIARGIMRAHEGDAELVDTHAGEGATFRLHLPEAVGPLAVRADGLTSSS